MEWTRSQFTIAVLVSMTALAFAIGHLLLPSVAVDSTTVGLVVIAALPWLAALLGSYVKSLKAPGGWEIGFQDLSRQVSEVKDEANKAQGAAQSAIRKADAALISTTEVVPMSFPVALTLPDSPERASGPEGVRGPARPRGGTRGIGTGGNGVGGATGAGAELAEAALRDLMAEYNKIRRTQFPGNGRTANMTAIVGRMIAMLPKVPTFDVRGALHSSNEGERLAAYASLYSRPEPDLLEDLVDTVTEKEPTPFGQYWGLQAIQRVMAGLDPSTIGPGTVRALRGYQDKLDRGIDRWYETERILEAFSSAAGPSRR